MTNKKALITFASIALLATVGITTSYAAGNFGDKEDFKAQMEERRDQMQQIFQDQDFSAWQAQMQERASEIEQQAQNIRNNATQENFDRLVQAHQLMQAGDQKAAREIMDQLHEDGGFGPMMGGRFDHKGPMGRMHQSPNNTDDSQS